MDERSRITVRLAGETIVGWPQEIVADHDKLNVFTTAKLEAALTTAKLEDGVHTLSLVFPTNVLLEDARQVDVHAEWLEVSRLRLRLAVSENPEDSDLSDSIHASHDTLKSHLEQMSAAITRVETMTPFLFGVLPDKFQKIFIEARAAATTALGWESLADHAGFESKLALLLLATDAIPALPQEQITRALDWGEGQGLLPAAHMIGVPIFKNDEFEPQPPKRPETLQVKLAEPFRTAFRNLTDPHLATALPWFENECVNQLLLASATDPLGAQMKIQHEALRTITDSLVGCSITLRGLADEAEFCALKAGRNPGHKAFLETIFDETVHLETRILNILPVFAGSGWAFAPEFRHALNPLLDNVINNLPPTAEITVLSQPMVDYLRILRILPAAAPAATTT